MNVDRTGLMEIITTLPTGIVRAVRALSITIVKVGIIPIAKVVIVAVKVDMATVVRLMVTTIVEVMLTIVWGAIIVAVRLMEIIARHTGMAEDSTIVRLARIMMDRRRLIPLLFPERGCLVME